MSITSRPGPSADIDDHKPRTREIEGQRLVFHENPGLVRARFLQAVSLFMGEAAL